MESVADQPPVVVILGPTASGKSALALQLARRFNGEIIAADSRTVYRGLDIGTAKPSVAERSAIPHHLIDVVDPDQPFTVADFQRQARAAIADIAGRGKLPIVVGGSGLYIDALIYDFRLRPPADPAKRRELAALNVEELQGLLASKGVALPENSKNQRHLIRALETEGQLAERGSLRPHTLVIGLEVTAEALSERVTRRVEVMVEQGLVDEVRRLAEHYGWHTPALATPAYKAFRPYLAGQCSLEQAKQQFIQNDRQYAKRQKTWFKRSSDIVWTCKSAQAVDLVTTFLNK